MWKGIYISYSTVYVLKDLSLERVKINVYR